VRAFPYEETEDIQYIQLDGRGGAREEAAVHSIPMTYRTAMDH